MATHARLKKYYLRAPRARKIAAVKAMASHGIARKIIGEQFGISQKTVHEYIHIELPAKWAEFEEDVRRMYAVQDFDMMQSLYRDLKIKMPKAKFRDVAELFKTLRTVSAPKQESKSLQQTNIKFEITDGTKESTGLTQKKQIIEGVEEKK